MGRVTNDFSELNKAPYKYKAVALIVAGGRGERSGLSEPKQYHYINGRAVLAHCVDILLSHSAIDEVFVVIHPDDDALFQAAMGERNIAPPIYGGTTRRASVWAGLQAIAAAGGAEHVLIHDAARPFVDEAVLERLLTSLHTDLAAIPVLPIVDSLVRNGQNENREGLMRVQTPQAFHFKSIFSAHNLWTGPEPTDDAEIARAAGIRVLEVAGDEKLRKLTLPSDFSWASQQVSKMISRTGLGFDVHAFCEGQSIWLGGVNIPHDRGLAGHSDADVTLHALTDAILGALAEGDIGDHFPPSDPQWLGAPSSIFLEYARDLVAKKHGVIDHVDLTIICEKPRIGMHRENIKLNIARLLTIDASKVSVKATTTEKLGFTGRQEGIACQAVTTIRLPEKF